MPFRIGADQPDLTGDQANALTALAGRVREIFTASSSGDVASAACTPCDRVYIDTSRNLGKRFCSTRCQSRVKAATHRAKSKG
jgi:predicted RNA-binding Zn ribbon-like protein